jgi:hypothetical protein
MAAVSVFAFSVENVLDGGAGESDLGTTFETTADCGGIEAAAVTGATLGRPILSEIVGGGAGASVCSGRDTGSGGGGVGFGCGATKPLPGTNS